MIVHSTLEFSPLIKNNFSSKICASFNGQLQTYDLQNIFQHTAQSDLLYCNIFTKIIQLPPNQLTHKNTTSNSNSIIEFLWKNDFVVEI